ncbi:hypothetical protein TEPIDINF_000548 [Tepidibacillus infernus]|uniref:CBS domain-containing protein n=1 Tax=Tepidibacillus decaturensis TaxID=1413211 RepID=A0A135L2G9_9BACI|nr:MULTISPECIES: hypothetical protein [Tepidibacillus]KXG43208.1 hypothetical protein U473_03630 [Tepidibacillus decaturensis]GBF10943.1 hypothetical protein HK1_00959 [Tepidibacillus sp. HK-1]
METVKLSTIVKFVSPDLENILTKHELESPVVLKNGIDSVTVDDMMEIIEAMIIQTKTNGTLFH